MKEQYKIFCDTYLQTFNASVSYAKAFPTAGEGTCMVNGCKLLKKQEIQEYLKERFKQASNDRIASVQEVLETLTRTLRQEAKEEVIVNKFVGDGISEVEIVEKKPCLREVLKAAELLGKRYALFTDKVEADVKQAVIFVGEDELED